MLKLILQQQQQVRTTTTTNITVDNNNNLCNALIRTNDIRRLHQNRSTSFYIQRLILK